MTARMVAAIGAVALALELAVAWCTVDPPDPAILQRIRAWDGHAHRAFMVLIPGTALHTLDDGQHSTIRLYEDGKPLGPWRSSFEDVRDKGGGRYLVGGYNGSAYVIFSASDNTSPSTNGRTYRVCDPEAPGHVRQMIGTESRFPSCQIQDPAAPDSQRAPPMRYSGSGATDLAPAPK